MLEGIAAGVTTMLATLVPSDPDPLGKLLVVHVTGSLSGGRQQDNEPAANPSHEEAVGCVGAGDLELEPTQEAPAELKDVKAEHDELPATAVAEEGTLRLNEGTLEWYGDLEQYSWTRRVCILVSTHPDFEFLVMLAIITNCVTLALYHPTEPADSGLNAKLFWAGEWACKCDRCRPHRCNMNAIEPWMLILQNTYLMRLVRACRCWAEHLLYD